MKISRYALIAALPFIGMAVSSCKVEEGENVQSRSVFMTQLVIPDDPSGEVTFQHKCNYVIRMDFMSNKLTVNCSSLNVDGVTGELRSDEMNFLTAAGNGIETIYFLTPGSGMLGSSKPVTELKGYLMNYVAPWNTSQVINSLVMSYDVPGATVKTINLTPRYYGTTITYFPTPAGNQTATTDDASYGVVFSEDMKKATVTMYNIKFAPNMPRPLEAVILKDLDVTLGQNGFTITGGNGKIPEVLDGGATTPYPNFPFSTITLSSKGDFLTEVDCHYEVEATIGERQMHFSADFSGRSADFMELKPL